MRVVARAEGRIGFSFGILDNFDCSYTLEGIPEYVFNAFLQAIVSFWQRISCRMRRALVKILGITILGLSGNSILQTHDGNDSEMPVNHFTGFGKRPVGIDRWFD